jgi:MFS family permease
LIIAMLAMSAVDSLMAMVVALWLFFTGFNLLEATLPSLIAKTAPPQSKGTAMGVYTSFQFIGVYLGGHLGGYLYGERGVTGVVVMAVVMLAIWLLLALTMEQPKYVSSYLLRVGELDTNGASELNQALLQVNGVEEVMIMLEEGVAYLKVDKKQLDEEALYRYSVN